MTTQKYPSAENECKFHYHFFLRCRGFWDSFTASEKWISSTIGSRARFVVFKMMLEMVNWVSKTLNVDLAFFLIFLIKLFRCKLRGRLLFGRRWSWRWRAFSLQWNRLHQNRHHHLNITKVVIIIKMMTITSSSHSPLPSMPSSPLFPKKEKKHC